MNEEGLLDIATENDLRLWISARPGDFLVPGAEILRAASKQNIGRDLAGRLQGCVTVGPRRTPDQDTEYAFQRLVEMALRALSPAMNATYMAIPCIDEITAGLCGIAERRMPSLRRCDSGGRERVLVTRGLTLASLTAGALGPIASAGRAHPQVIARLVEATRVIGAHARSDDDRLAIQRLGRAFLDEAKTGLATERERAIAGVGEESVAGESDAQRAHEAVARSGVGRLLG
jgi:uncharacterized membrane protein